MDLYRNMQTPTRAYPHLPKVIEGKKDDPACLIVAGDLARRSADFQMALQCFDQVQTMDNPQLAEMVRGVLFGVRYIYPNSTADFFPPSPSPKEDKKLGGDGEGARKSAVESA